MDILYQDNSILVCIKPAGVLSTDEPGGMPELVRQALGDPKACVRTVQCPTATPGTSVSALRGPRGSFPMEMPKSEMRRAVMCIRSFPRIFPSAGVLYHRRAGGM